jgi:hypothetical protein
VTFGKWGKANSNSGEKAAITIAKHQQPLINRIIAIVVYLYDIRRFHITVTGSEMKITCQGEFESIVFH